MCHQRFPRGSCSGHNDQHHLLVQQELQYSSSSSGSKQQCSTFWRCRRPSGRFPARLMLPLGSTFFFRCPLFLKIAAVEGVRPRSFFRVLCFNFFFRAQVYGVLHTSVDSTRREHCLCSAGGARHNEGLVQSRFLSFVGEREDERRTKRLLRSSVMSRRGRGRGRHVERREPRGS